MIKERALKDVLLAVVNQSKTNYVMISSALNELVALRETVRGLDPTFAEVLEDRRKQSQELSREVVAQTIALYDEIVARVAAGEVC